MVAQTALRRLRLDRLWWMVTPGNPLKDNSGLPTLEERMEAVSAMVDDPRITVTGLEAELGTYYTVDTLAALSRRCRGVRFVWIMGGDNMASFHRWGGWRQIMRSVPIAIIDRPGSTHRAVRSKAAVMFESARLDETDAALLASLPAPAWMMLHGRRSDLSSSQLRQITPPHSLQR
jgi:nicotinate-nucleotide adenylyltransferase